MMKIIAKGFYPAIFIVTLSIILDVNMSSGFVFFFAGYIWACENDINDV